MIPTDNVLKHTFRASGRNQSQVQRIKRTAKMQWTTVAALLSLTSLVLVASAAPRNTPNNFTWGELALLPEYCRDTQGTVWGGPGGEQSPAAPKWLALMGDDFWHMHHYCYGLRDMLQADRAISDQAKRHLYGDAVNQYRYVITNARESMVLMPEVYYRLGEALIKQGDTASANEALEAARRLKPDYWPAYLLWVDQLIAARQITKAKELTARGLTFAPDSKLLQQRMRELDRLSK